MARWFIKTVTETGVTSLSEISSILELVMKGASIQCRFFSILLKINDMDRFGNKQLKLRLKNEEVISPFQK